MKFNSRKYFCNSDVFLNGDALSYYLLGAFVTDGCVSQAEGYYRISLTSKDIDWLESIRNYICPSLPVKKSKDCHWIYFSDKKIKDWLMEHGCVERKSLILEVKNIPKEYYPDFIRGSLDGDGSFSVWNCKRISTRNFLISMTSGSKKFLEQIQYFLQENNIKSKIYTITLPNRIIRNKLVKESTINLLKVQQKSEIIKLINLIYYNDNLICLDRKKQKAKEILECYKQDEENKKINNKKQKPSFFRKTTKIQWPSHEELVKLYKLHGCSGVGKILKTDASNVIYRISRIKKLTNIIL